MEHIGGAGAFERVVDSRPKEHVDSFAVLRGNVPSVPNAELIAEMWACPEPYCTPGGSSEICAKFSAGLMHEWPKLIDEMALTTMSRVDALKTKGKDDVGPCSCGCGATIRGTARFLPGHGPKLSEVSVPPPGASASVTGPIHWGSVTLVLSSELCRRGVQLHPHERGVQHPVGGVRI